jgi:hypothetical protein
MLGRPPPVVDIPTPEVVWPDYKSAQDSSPDRSITPVFLICVYLAMLEFISQLNPDIRFISFVVQAAINKMYTNLVHEDGCLLGCSTE